MNGKDSVDIELLELRKQFMRRELETSKSLKDISDAIANFSGRLFSEVQRLEKNVVDQRQDAVETTSGFTDKIDVLEDLSRGQFLQITQMTEERALLLSEIAGLNDYINKITERHHVRQNELLSRFETGFSALKALMASIEALKLEDIAVGNCLAVTLKSVEINQRKLLERVGERDISDLCIREEDTLHSAPLIELDTNELSDVELLVASEFFDSEWYSRRYGVAFSSTEDAALHYLEEGYRKGYSPSKGFDGRAYLATNGDVASANVNPLIHYIRFGKSEGRAMTALKTAIIGGS